jgi:hypothetical protein
MAGALETVASEMAKCRSDLATVKEVRCDEGCSQPADDYTIRYGNGDANHHSGIRCFLYKEII